MAPLVVLAVAAVGCSQAKPGDTQSTAGPQALAAASAATPTANSRTPGVQGPQHSVLKFTKQGTNLLFGQRAIVPFKSKHRKGALGIIVTTIQKGDPNDLTPLKLGDRAAGMTPYYVRVIVSDESGGKFPGASISSLNGILG
ncbi:MAG: hypothetical protein ACRDTS_15920, partial [Mycobacterium sp.]